MTQTKSLISISHSQLFSRLPLDQISFISFTLTSLRIEDRLMPLCLMLVCNTQLNHGVLVELLLVFPELLDLVLTEVVKLHSVTCVERDECLPPSRPGEDGTEESTSNKRDMLLPLPWLPLVLFPWYWLVVIVSTKSLNYHWSLKIDLNPSRRPRKQSHSSRDSEPSKTSKKSSIIRLSELDSENSETRDTE